MSSATETHDVPLSPAGDDGDYGGDDDDDYEDVIALGR